MRTVIAALALMIVTPGLAETCRPVNVDGTDPASFSGTLTFTVFPGAPNFTDVRAGDQPEPTYVLTLDEPVCASGGDEGVDHSTPITRVQLLAPSNDRAGQTLQLLSEYRGQHVAIRTKNVDVATTAHHYAPLLAEVVSVTLEGLAIPGTEQLGTTTVRGFYAALSAGDGGEAAKFILPELRKQGPLSADAMSTYYSTLVSPLKLKDIRALGINSYQADYFFISRSGVCNGQAVVTTERRGDLTYISRIHSLTGC